MKGIKNRKNKRQPAKTSSLCTTVRVQVEEGGGISFAVGRGGLKELMFPLCFELLLDCSIRKFVQYTNTTTATKSAVG